MGNRLTQIATRTGDAGTTGLGDNTRVSKNSLRVHAMGDVDELNSNIGVLLCEDMPERVRAVAHFHPVEIEVVCCGSYRRGRPSSGDVDILIAPVKRSGTNLRLSPFIDQLTSEGFLTLDLRQSVGQFAGEKERAMK